MISRWMFGWLSQGLVSGWNLLTAMISTTLRTLLCLVQWSAMCSDLFCGSVLRAVVLTPVPVFHSSMASFAASLQKCTASTILHSFIHHTPPINHHPPLIQSSSIHHPHNFNHPFINWFIHHDSINQHSSSTFNLLGTSTKCFKLRGVTTTREKQKKVHRFADKLVVPPQSV